MEERTMYTPKLREDLVQRLYPLCQRLELPMTRFVNEAVAQAVARAEAQEAKAEPAPAAAAG
jgi:predicted transcriptional regulator